MAPEGDAVQDYETSLCNPSEVGFWMESQKFWGKIMEDLGWKAEWKLIFFLDGMVGL